MRKLIARIIASLMLLAMSAECSGSGSGSGSSSTPGSFVADPAQQAPPWSASVQAATTPIVLNPGQTIVIIIQLVPINGFVFTSPVFFNAFTFVNPNLVFACPGIITVGSPIIGPISVVGGFPTVTFPISPIGFGSCVIPINAGVVGVIPLNVQVSGASTASTGKQYLVRITKGR